MSVLAHAASGGIGLPHHEATVVLGLGLLVVIAVVYDYYRHQWSG